MTAAFLNSGLTDDYVQDTDSFIIVYGGITVTLPAPLFGDQEEYDHEVIKRELINKNFVTLNPTEWIGTRVFRYQFEHVPREQSDAFGSLVSASLGKPVAVTDHYDRSGTCLLIEPEVSIGYFGDNEQCKDVIEVMLRWL